MIPRLLTFKSLFFTGIFFLVFPLALAQELSPLIQNYSRADYSGSLQNWSIDQAENGLIYVGNHSGLLQFDGETWQVFELPKKSVIRSIKCIDNRIYIGSYEEFGYFEKINHKLKYHSISEKLENHQFSNDEFWSIDQFGDQVYFRSFSDIFQYNPETEDLQVFYTPFTPSAVFEVNNTVYTTAVNGSIYQLNENYTQIEDTPMALKSQSIRSISITDQQSLICSRDFDCFVFDGQNFKKFDLPQHNFFESNVLNDLQRFENGDILFSSIQKGSAILSDTEVIQFSQDAPNGIRNSTVLDALIDQEQNIWLALDDGISYIYIQSPTRYYIDHTGKLGAVYTAKYFNNKLYLGSNRGLFTFEGNNLIRIEGITDQVWFLEEFGDDLICGHNKGTSKINGLQSQLISDITGGWSMKAIPSKSNYYLQSNYTGLSTIHKTTDGSWNARRFPEFTAPIEFFEWIDNQSILAADANKGLYEIRFTNSLDSIKNVKEFTTQYLPNDNNLSLLKIGKDIFVVHADQIYRFHSLEPYFEVDQSLQNLFPGKVEEFSRHKNSSNLWGLGESLWRYNKEAQTTQSIAVRYLNEFHIPNHLNIIEIDENQNLATINNGYILFSNNKSSRSSAPTKSPVLHSFSNQSENIQFKEIFKYQEPVYIQFSSPEYTKDISYQYRFSQNEDWERTESPFLSFENFPSGKYHFQIRSFYPNGDMSETVSHDFKVRNHILLRWWTLLLYALLFFTLYRLNKIRLTRQQRKKQVLLKKQLHDEHQHKQREDRLLHEKQLADLQNQQLSHSIELKKKELANITLSLVKKNELLTDIKKQLIQAEKQQPHSQIRKVLRSIDSSLTDLQNWELFETQLNEVHKDFFTELKREFPDLTKKDLKLCAFLKTGLSSKEIAPLMNISTRGVETHRYRLRKKIGIDSSENLHQYLEGLD